MSTPSPRIYAVAYALKYEGHAVAGLTIITADGYLDARRQAQAAMDATYPASEYQDRAFCVQMVEDITAQQAGYGHIRYDLRMREVPV